MVSVCTTRLASALDFGAGLRFVLARRNPRQAWCKPVHGRPRRRVSLEPGVRQVPYAFVSGVGLRVQHRLPPWRGGLRLTLCLAGSQAPAWEPLSCKLLLGRSSGSWNFKTPIPKQELGNEQNTPVLRRVGKQEKAMRPRRPLLARQPNPALKRTRVVLLVSVARLSRRAA